MRFKMGEFSVSLQDITVILINCRHLIKNCHFFCMAQLLNLILQLQSELSNLLKLWTEKKIRIETTSQSIMYSSDLS